MSPQQQQRERRIEAMADKVRKPGEFIHMDRRTPRLASGQVVTKAMLKALQDRGVVDVVNFDLMRRPMQFAAPGAVTIDAGPGPEAPISLAPGSVNWAADYERTAGEWTAGNRAAARALWLSGVSKADVARRFKTSRGFIVRMAKVDRWPKSCD